MTPHGAHGHIQRPSNLFRIQIFAKTQDHHCPWLLRQRSDQPTETLLEQRVRLRGSDRNLRQFLDLHLLSETRTARRVNAAMNRSPAKPGNTMRTRSDGPTVLKQFQKHFLSHFFRYCRIKEEVKGDAVDQALMFVNDALEFGFGHLPSELITIHLWISTQNPF